MLDTEGPTNEQEQAASELVNATINLLHGGQYFQTLESTRGPKNRE